MIKYLKRKLLYWLQDIELEKQEVIYIPQDSIETSVIQFEIRPAIGGRILRVTRNIVDSRQGKVDRDVDTYIITESDNLGERVARIINLQAYK